MNLSSPFIKRPIATTLLAVALVLVGALALHLLPMAPLPRVNVPTVKVSARLPGASAQTMANAVATPLERVLGQIAGVTLMTSHSQAGATTIRLVFDLHRNIHTATHDVQAAINAAQGQLPPGMPSRPSYREVSSSDAPIMVLALTSRQMTPAQMYQVAATTFSRALAQIPGVGEVQLAGSSIPAIRVALDPAAMNRHGVGFEAVRQAIATADAHQPLGAFAATGHHWQLATNDALADPEQFASLIVAHHHGTALQLGAIAKVTRGVADPYNAGLADGQRAVLAIIQRKPDANILEVVDRINRRLPALRKALPTALRVSTILNRANNVRASFDDARGTLLLAMVLVVAVMLMFLRNVRAALIASVAAPLSILGTLAGMYALGYSLDNLSLMALTIAVGFAVDDAVVVVENITRHMESSRPPHAAAHIGAGEISLTVLSMSMTLVAVFIPLLFLRGYVGLFVREFAVTIALVIGVSLLVSLTIVPMLCAWLLKPDSAELRQRRAQRPFARAFNSLLAAYDRSLTWTLQHGPLTMLVLACVIGFNLYLYGAVPRGFFPRQDTGELTGSFDVGGSGSFALARRKLKAFVATVRADPAVSHVAAYVHGSSGTLFAGLKPLGERTASADAVAARLGSRLAHIPGANFTLKSVQDIRMGGHRSRSSDEYTVQADSLAELRTWAPRIERALASLPQLRDVTSNSAGQGLETFVNVNRDTAGRLGVSFRQIDSVLHDAFGQRHVARVDAPDDAYPVVMNVASAHARSPQVLQRLQISDDKNQRVPLSVLAHVRQQAAPLGVDHQGQFVATTISFNPAPGVSLSQATAAIRNAVNNLATPATVHGSFQGSARAFRQVVQDEPTLLGVAFITLFIILGVLYESYVHPLTILSTLPSAGIGALLALLAFRGNVGVIGLIGIFALVGIVMKNAIMMVDFALDAQRTGGATPEQAIRQACLLRLRPILMTSLAVMLAAIPLATMHGNGAEMRQPLGIAIGGGLVTSQLLTLYTTPVVYLYLDRFNKWIGKWLHGKSASAPRSWSDTRGDSTT